MKRLPDLSVYLVLDRALCGSTGMVKTAVAAVKAGVRVVQLRDKDADTQTMIGTGRELLAVLSGTGALLVSNDDVDAAAALEGVGIHVGQEDADARAVRARLGPEPILGVSVESPQAARAIDPALVDYVGAGPVFATTTKSDHKKPVGFDGLARIIAAAPVPAVAIGGVKAEHARDVLKAGAQGLAVVSAICGQPDPRVAAKALVQAVRSAEE